MGSTGVSVAQSSDLGEFDSGDPSMSVCVVLGLEMKGVRGVADGEGGVGFLRSQHRRTAQRYRPPATVANLTRIPAIKHPPISPVERRRRVSESDE